MKIKKSIDQNFRFVSFSRAFKTVRVACPMSRAVGFKFRMINSDFCYLYKKAQC